MPIKIFSSRSGRGWLEFMIGRLRTSVWTSRTKRMTEIISSINIVIIRSSSWWALWNPHLSHPKKLNHSEFEEAVLKVRLSGSSRRIFNRPRKLHSHQMKRQNSLRTRLFTTGVTGLQPRSPISILVMLPPSLTPIVSLMTAKQTWCLPKRVFTS